MDVRINKFLSSAGVCSRREADRLVQAGRVEIDAVRAGAGSRVADGQRVFLDGKEIVPGVKPVFLVFHKPAGIVCTTTAAQGNNNIIDYIDYPERIFPVGRLDKDSRGLIFLTNQGELSDEILRSANGHEKEYMVTVNKGITEDFLRLMAGGLYLKELNRTTNPCRIERTGFKTFRIILKQGLNRQIRRMCEALSYEVKDLLRVRIMNVKLGDLPEGEYRELTAKEYEELMKELRR